MNLWKMPFWSAGAAEASNSYALSVDPESQSKTLPLLDSTKAAGRPPLP